MKIFKTSSKPSTVSELKVALDVGKFSAEQSCSEF